MEEICFCRGMTRYGSFQGRPYLRRNHRGSWRDRCRARDHGERHYGKRGW
jgi:hypothetical protein